MGASRRQSGSSSGSNGSDNTGNRFRMKKMTEAGGIDNANFNMDEVDGWTHVHLHEEPAKQTTTSVVPYTVTVLPTTIDADYDLPLPTTPVDEGPSWSELSAQRKILRVLMAFVKLVLLLALLYFFVCALDILSSSFRLVAGRGAASIFQSGSLLANPVAGLMVGVMVTVLLQSSSTSTSILVAMVGSGILEVKVATFIIMGANIGTSVTSTIVAMTQAGDKEIFRRAFAGGTVHDMFNWLTVLVLLPIEAASHYLYEMTKYLTANIPMPEPGDAPSKVQGLQEITRPFTNLIVQINDSTLAAWAKDVNDTSKMMYRICGRRNVTHTGGPDIAEEYYCKHMFARTSLSDENVGVILLICSLVVICTSLIILVKILSSMLKGSVAKVIHRTLNYDFPHPFTFLTGYLALAIGAGMTVIVQSSSVFTSTLTPLVGLGVISVERMYPLTLGSNIGTTATSVLAALASSPATFRNALQTSLIHFFFNLSGVLLWYTPWFMRIVPIGAAKFLGNTTAKYRWFALAYLLVVFLIVPGLVFLLSWAGNVYLGIVGSIVLFLIACVTVIKVLQHNWPHLLPPVLQTWKWLPEPLRSLRPLDRVIRKVFRVVPCCRKIVTDGTENEVVVVTRQAAPPAATIQPMFSVKSDSPMNSKAAPVTLIRSGRLD